MVSIHALSAYLYFVRICNNDNSIRSCPLLIVFIYWSKELGAHHEIYSVVLSPLDSHSFVGQFIQDRSGKSISEVGWPEQQVARRPGVDRNRA